MKVNGVSGNLVVDGVRGAFYESSISSVSGDVIVKNIESSLPSAKYIVHSVSGDIKALMVSC